MTIILRSAEEGRLVLSNIESQVGSEVLCNWIKDGCDKYKSGVRVGCLYNFLIGYAEERFNDKRIRRLPSMEEQGDYPNE